MYGDNNILVSVGHAGDTNRFIEIEGYRALEGVQILIGTDIDLNVKSRGSKLFLICVVCVVCVAYVVCVGLKFFLVN
jgi:hypothetical protein